jgi:hypothetical protein
MLYVSLFLVHPALGKLFEHCSQGLQEKLRKVPVASQTGPSPSKILEELPESMRKDGLRTLLGLHSCILLLNKPSVNSPVLQDLVKVFLVHQVLLRYLPLQNR